MQTAEHKRHITENCSYQRCPECRADNSRWHAQTKEFRYGHVHAYLSWIRPRLEAIRNGENSLGARRWREDFVAALNTRISSHIPQQNGRKHAPEYAKYHLATYGNDFRFLHAL